MIEMIDKEMLMEALTEEECLLADGYEDALIGITEGMNPVAVYNTDKCIEILMRDDELTHEDALELIHVLAELIQSLTEEL